MTFMFYYDVSKFASKLDISTNATVTIKGSFQSKIPQGDWPITTWQGDWLKQLDKLQQIITDTVLTPVTNTLAYKVSADRLTHNF